MSAVGGKRIELWVEPRPGEAAVNAVMRQLLDDLAGGRARIAVRVPEHEIVSPGYGRAAAMPDLILLKTVTSLGLSRALAEEARGARCLNEARPTWRASDKALVVATLAAAGLPVPATYLTTPANTVSAPPPDGSGPWVSKPTRGIHGNGVVTHEAFPQTLSAASAGASFVVDDGTRLGQQRIGGDAADLKVYVAGLRCFAGRKRFAPGSHATDRVEPVELDGETTALVLAAGEALGLRCFGVDLRFHGRAPVIVDLNPFPGYRGFPVAVAALRTEIEAALREASAA